MMKEKLTSSIIVGNASVPSVDSKQQDGIFSALYTIVHFVFIKSNNVPVAVQ